LGIDNTGTIDTGSDDDTIIGNGNLGDYYTINETIGISNSGTIKTGDGNDTITGTGTIGIFNDGNIYTGAGDDSIVADGRFSGSGNVFLGCGRDYLKGFGTGTFSGGACKDTLELTTGTYTVGLSGTAVSFTDGSSIMSTTDFETLIAGGTTFDFTSLSTGQVITVV
jgi:hypothetical protein